MTEQPTFNPQSVTFPAGPSRKQREADGYRERAMLRAENARLEALVKSLQDALGTAEAGADLVSVARAAHRAEQELAGLLIVQEGLE